MEGRDFHVGVQAYSSREDHNESTNDNKSEPSDEEFYDFGQVHSALESEERGANILSPDVSEPADHVLASKNGADTPNPKDEEVEADLLGLNTTPAATDNNAVPSQIMNSSSNAALLDDLFSDNPFSTDCRTENLLGSGEDFFFSGPTETSAETGSSFDTTFSASDPFDPFAATVSENKSGDPDLFEGLVSPHSASTPNVYPSTRTPPPASSMDFLNLASRTDCERRPAVKQSTAVTSPLCFMAGAHSQCGKLKARDVTDTGIEHIAGSASHTPIQRCQRVIQRRNKVLAF
ncbi:unnamed protein product [Ranitomeya imitator]|uniref:Uncharacterized protein n=1 Tax=Ranitomeya imitator TaxID=111125 RepID=A0ABN9KW36_9NEOB|nr:unnamed protein product [Ranitomeya imitator]